MDLTISGRAVALWAGLHLLVLLVLSVLVVRQRRKHGVALGDGGAPELARAIRAFGNATEYIPAAMIALATLALAGARPGIIHIVGTMMFCGRLLHGYGLWRTSEASAPRAAGMVLTWLAFLFSIVALLLHAVR